MIFKKIINQKWLSVCLLLGIIFLVATVSCFPMFENGSTDLMIRNEFENYKKAHNQQPMIIFDIKKIENDKGLKADELASMVDEVMENQIKQYPDLEVLCKQKEIMLDVTSVKTNIFARGGVANIIYDPDIEQHIHMEVGVNIFEADQDDINAFISSNKKIDDDYLATASDASPSDASPMGASENGGSDDNIIDCIISEVTMDDLDVSLGEEITLTRMFDSAGKNPRLRVVGIYGINDTKDIYWVDNPNDNGYKFYITKESIDKCIDKYNMDKVGYKANVVYNYKAVNGSNVDRIMKATEKLLDQDENRKSNFYKLYPVMKRERKLISVSIWVFQIPLLGMVFAFIFMVSKQMLESEKNEIAMMYSRGFFGRQIIFRYTKRVFYLSVIGVVLGVPTGYLICKMAANTTNFLTFGGNGAALYKPIWSMISYGIFAAILGLIVIVIPSIKYSKISIVTHKSTDKVNKKMIWEKFFLDVIGLIGVIYLAVNYYKGLDAVRKNAHAGDKMDPMIFMSAILFILTAGLITIRLSHYIIKLVYRLGRNKWKPAKYASFLQISRSFNKQCFISTFMIITIAMGIFSANAARTVNGNYEARIRYGNANEMSVKEHWNVRFYYLGQAIVDYDYIEPGIAKFDNLVKKGLCDSYAKVINDDSIILKNESGLEEYATLEAIDTKQFGLTACFENRFNEDHHWFEDLNKLGEDLNNILISENLAKRHGIKVGDRLSCKKMGEYGTTKETVRGERDFVVCGIIDNWPGYEKCSYSDVGEYKENYRVIVNYTSAVETFETLPYTVWLNLADGVSPQDVKKELGEDKEGIKYTTMENELSNLQDNYILKIINGMFNLSFFIALVLCAIGFLIYWVVSIGQRQLLFGIYRAMGMTVKEVNQMLANEHMFSTAFSVVAGMIVGALASVIFTKLFVNVYMPEEHNLDIFIEYNVMDYVKLGIIIASVIFVCITFLKKMIKNMDIGKALKLGED